MFLHKLYIRNFCAKYEYTFVEVIFFAAIFLLCYNPSQYRVADDGLFFHGPHIKISSNFKPGSNGKRNIEQTQVNSENDSTEENVNNFDTNSLSIADGNILSASAINVAEASTVAVENGLGISAGGDLIYLGQEDLDKYFQEMKELGATWVRWDVDWSVIQPNRPDGYEWSGADRITATAKKYGIKSLGIITYAPQWAQTKSCPSGKRCPPSDVNTFARFAGDVAARYKGSVDAWEIWNEPNYYIFWYPNADAGKYAELLKAAYGKIKEANPQATVLLGGLVMIDSDGKSISPTSFMESLYGSGAKNYFDAAAVHPYSYPISPNYSADWNGWKQMNSVRQLMVNKGDGGKKIWLTEYGAPTGGSGKKCELNELNFTYNQDYMSEDAQQAMAKDAAALYAKSKSWMGPFFWYNLRDASSDGTTPEDFFGLLRYDGSKKPAYETLKNAFLK